ncbi:hypothetical protein N2152v2_005728 [Parachlorella kessleri]
MSPSRLAQPGPPNNGDELVPLPKRRSTLLTVCPYILIAEFCERLTFIGLATNLVMYLTRVMGEESGFAAIQINLFEGTCYLTPLLGAWLADSMWGRYKTIMVFSGIYFMGMVMLALTAAIPSLTPDPEHYPTLTQNAVLYTSLYIVALGTGGIKPNVSAFGADQFDESDPQDRKEKTSFFNWFYFFVNIGSLLAVTVIVWIQENISWAVGFAVPAACMGLAILTFLAGSPLYTHVAPTESPISRVFKVVWTAYKARGYQNIQYAPPDPEGTSTPLLGSAYGHGEYDNVNGGGGGNGHAVGGPNGEFSFPAVGGGGGGGVGRSGSAASLGGGLHKTASLQFLDKAAEVGMAGALPRFTQRQVEEVKLVIRMLPVFFATILYWTIYNQMGTFFVVQGSYMDRTVALPGGRSFVIPAASLAMINTLAVVLLIPVYDKGLAPLLRKLKRPIKLLQRIGWGLVVCVGAMLVAAAVEWYRLDIYHRSHPTTEGDLEHKTIVPMSVWWQIPQYLLVGLSEVFTSIGQLEFFYDQAPDVMRSCSMALQLLSVCVGSYLSGAVVYGITRFTAAHSPTGQGWLPKDLNEGRLDLFFLLLAALMALNLLLFLWVAMKYEYKAIEHVRRVAVRPTAVQRPPGWQPIPRAPVPVPGISPAHAIPGRPPLPSPSPVGLYGRSVTFMPKSPALPATRR